MARNAGLCELRQGDVATAIAELQRAMNMDPSDQEYVLELSEVLIGSNNPEAATALLEPAR